MFDCPFFLDHYRELKYLEVFKLLPGTNCRECGQPTCLAFATRLVQQEAGISQCSPLRNGQFEEKRKKLLEMLKAAGYVNHHDPPLYPQP